MIQIDPLGFVNLIPQGLKQKALDTLVDFVADQATKFASDEIAAKIKKLRSDAAFNQNTSTFRASRSFSHVTFHLRT